MYPQSLKLNIAVFEINFLFKFFSHSWSSRVRCRDYLEFYIWLFNFVFRFSKRDFMDGVASIPLGFHSEEHGYDTPHLSLSAGKLTMLVVRMSII